MGNQKEKQKKGIVKKIFMIIGIVVTVFMLVVIIVVGILALVKPYDIDIIKVIPTVLDKNPTSSYDHPYLTIQQEAILESVGIDPQDVPTEITPSQQECSAEALGWDRVNDIAAGSTPTLTDVLKAKHCFE